MSTDIKVRPRRIEIPGDILILDEDFCAQVLAGASKRTSRRMEALGLPYVMIAGCKYRQTHHHPEPAAAATPLHSPCLKRSASRSVAETAGRKSFFELMFVVAVHQAGPGNPLDVRLQ